MQAYRNPGKITFTAIIHRREGGGAFIDFPYSIEETFGVKGRIPVNALIDGLPYQGSLVNLGNPLHMLLIKKEIREKLGKDRGDEVQIILELDTSERTIAIPEDVQVMLKKESLTVTFKRLAYSHKKEYIQWIDSAKRSETREKRIISMIGMIKQKQ